MEKLNRDLLEQVKRGFVSMPGGDPNAGMPPSGADPNAMPPGGDPAAMGAPPPGGDPNAMPPPGGDPNAMPPPGPPPGGQGSAGGPADMSAMQGAMGAGPTGQIVLTPTEFIQIIQAFQGGGKSKAPKDGGQPAGGQAAPAAGGDPRIDQILQILQGAMGGGQPPPAQ